MHSYSYNSSSTIAHTVTAIHVYMLYLEGSLGRYLERLLSNI